MVTEYLRRCETMNKKEQNRLKIPEFPPNHAWFNVSKPLTVENHLRGKITLIDFWTYCCINCLHVLPDMEYLEHKFK